MQSNKTLMIGLATVSLAMTGCGLDDPNCEGSARLIQGVDSALEEVVDGNSAFALELHQALAVPTENFFFSPFSISVALGMTEMGAGGETQSQMADLLRISSDEPVWHSGLGGLGQDVGSGQHCAYQLDLANRLFAQDGYPFLASFLEDAEAAYGAPVETLDFATQPEESRQYINSWISDVTQEKIPNFLAPGVVGPSTVMVLVNAIYFKGDWAEQFDAAKTNESAVFTRDDAQEVAVAMMSSDTELRYRQLDDGSQIVELPYAGEELSMTVVLPPEGVSLADFEAGLDDTAIASWSEGLEQMQVFLSLPRFEMRFKASLKEVLQDLGMVEAFGNGADFSRMTEQAIMVSDVIHEAYVKVNEEGTEAAAVTGVVMREASVPPSAVFEADRPFVFQIRDNLTDSILFMGHVADPSLAAE